MKKLVRHYRTQVTPNGVYFELRFDVVERRWGWVIAGFPNDYGPEFQPCVGFKIPCMRGMTRAQIIAAYEGSRI